MRFQKRSKIYGVTRDPTQSKLIILINEKYASKDSNTIWIKWKRKKKSESMTLEMKSLVNSFGVLAISQVSGNKMTMMKIS